MADTNIEWATKVWNPTRGCSRVSEGCRHCYAERQAIRHAGPGGSYEGLVRLGKQGPVWTGDVRLVEGKLREPLGWRPGHRVFVNSMSDLFHEKLAWERHIDRVWQVMVDCPRHAYLVLTKRAENMRDFVQDWYRRSMAKVLPQIWLGVSVEDQATADERIPLLLDTPAAVRFVSFEPALGPVDFRSWLARRCGCGLQTDACDGWKAGMCRLEPPRVSWVIVGGESGPGARPFDIEWARQTVRECRQADVPCFVKQIGARPFSGACEQVGRRYNGGFPEVLDRKGGDPAEWPADLRVREFPRPRSTP